MKYATLGAIGLLSSTQAAYSYIPASTKTAQAIQASSVIEALVPTDTAILTYRANGYTCLRLGNTWLWPQTASATAVTTGTTRAFYATTVAQLGTQTGTIATSDSTECCSTFAANGECITAFQAGGTTAITNKLGAILANTSGVTNSPAKPMNLDFMLAATNQVSLASGGTRAAADYCDVQEVSLTAAPTGNVLTR